MFLFTKYVQPSKMYPPLKLFPLEDVFLLHRIDGLGFCKCKFKNLSERGFLFLIAHLQQAKLFFLATTKNFKLCSN